MNLLKPCQDEIVFSGVVGGNSKDAFSGVVEGNGLIKWNFFTVQFCSHHILATPLNELCKM